MLAKPLVEFSEVVGFDTSISILSEPRLEPGSEPETVCHIFFKKNQSFILSDSLGIKNCNISLSCNPNMYLTKGRAAPIHHRRWVKRVQGRVRQCGINTLILAFSL